MKANADMPRLRPVSGNQESLFLQMVRENDSFPEPMLTSKKTGKGRKSGYESTPISIEMRT